MSKTKYYEQVKASDPPMTETYYFTDFGMMKYFPKTNIWIGNAGAKPVSWWLRECLTPQTIPWQLCPKCLGDGNLARYNSPAVTSDACPLCDVCNGQKIIPEFVLEPKKA